MTTYVYAPLPDFLFDQYFPALVESKNTQKGDGQYALIDRQAANGLDAVRNGDRLYVGIHGSVTGRVYNTGAAPGENRAPEIVMTGHGLAEFLAAAGLPKRRFRLYLWVCNSSSPAADSEHWSSTGTNVLAQVAARLRQLGYFWITVIGYDQEVSLQVNSVPRVATGITQNHHKMLLLPPPGGGAAQPQVPTHGHRTVVRTFLARVQ